MKNIARFLALAALGLAAACSSDGEPGGSEVTRMVVQKGCLLTACEDLIKHSEYLCEECLSACSGSYDCDLSSSCELSCSSPSCSDGQRAKCVKEGFEAKLPPISSAKVQSACLGAMNHAIDCGFEAPFDYQDCVAVASIARDDYASSFDCLGKLACADLGSDAAVSACAAKPSAFGAQLCKDLASRCPSFACSPETQDYVDLLGQVARPDVLDAGSACASQKSCDDISACFEAWLGVL